MEGSGRSSDSNWRSAVKIVRATELAGAGRATAFDFSGAGGQKTWLGTVTLAPNVCTGLHHHGRHEVAIYVVRGRSEIRWGERLQFATDIGPGDFVYFAPFVPHQELNPDNHTPLELVVVRSDNERIALALDGTPVEQPERL